MDKKIQLQDIERPNLYRDIFPYTEFPKVTFEEQAAVMEIPEKVWITDTTFRDGQQSRPPYMPEQILRIFDFFHEINGGTDLIRQSEFFLYSDRDRKAVELCKERGYDFPEITGWIRAVAADFKFVTRLELKETGILTSASDYHIFLKLKKTRAQAMEAYLNVPSTSLGTGRLRLTLWSMPLPFPAPRRLRSWRQPFKSSRYRVVSWCWISITAAVRIFGRIWPGAKVSASWTVCRPWPSRPGEPLLCGPEFRLRPKNF